MKKIIGLIIFLSFFSGCQTCLTEEEIDKVRKREPFKDARLSSINGVYHQVIPGLWGELVEGRCETYIKDGVVKTQNKTIHINNPKLLLFGKQKVFEFEDKGILYQLFISPEKIDLVSINEWLTLIKVKAKNKEKKNEQ